MGNRARDLSKLKRGAVRPTASISAFSASRAVTSPPTPGTCTARRPPPPAAAGFAMSAGQVAAQRASHAEVASQSGERRAGGGCEGMAGVGRRREAEAREPEARARRCPGWVKVLHGHFTPADADVGQDAGRGGTRVHTVG